MDEWWKDALFNWSHALHFTYSILSISPPQKQRVFGEWFLRNGMWCIQLSGSLVAQINKPACDESIRNALTWTLKTIHDMHKESSEKAFCDLLLELADASLEKVRDVLDGASNGPELSPVLIHEPGYMLWIRFDDDVNQTYFSSEGADEGIDTVIEAFSAQGWHAWFSYRHPRDSILLFQPMSALPSEMEHEMDGILGSDDGRLVEQRAISFYAKSLAAMLESDAMVVPTIFVSQRITSAGDIHSAIATLALVHQKHLQNPGSSRLSCFADRQLDYWMALIPENLRALFLKWSEREAEQSGVILQKEISDVLEGLLHANLNVSEAARALYLHRNTLVNRIERIRQLTGFDIRSFFDAATLWMILKLKNIV